jgi:Prp8 binding protein
MASIKRPSTSSDALIKRQRVEEEDGLQQMIVSSNGTSHKGALIQSVRRTSGLSAPIMALQVSEQASSCGKEELRLIDVFFFA